MVYRSKTNWAAVILAVLFIGAVVFLGVVTEGFKNWDTSTWFEKEEKDPSVVVDGDGNHLADGNVHALPRAMVFRSSTLASGENTAVTLQATLEGENLGNDKVDWSVAFVDPKNDWANGKTATDYLSVTPTADGSLTATVTCLQDFGAQILVKVTSRDNITISAECVVDLQQKLSGVKVTFSLFDMGAFKSYLTLTPDSAAGTIVPTFVTSMHSMGAVKILSEVYTLPAEDSAVAVTIKPTTALNSALTSAGFNAAPNIGIAGTGESGNFTGFPGAGFFSTVVATNWTPAQENRVYDVFRGLSSQAVYNVVVSVGGDTFVTYPVKFDMSTIQNRVEGISLDKDTIVF